MPEPRTLVIGDVHGHTDRLTALLEQEGIIDENHDRIDTESRVIQLGDLGHFGYDETDDEGCYALAVSGAIDHVLWGNHDRAVVDDNHIFSSFRRPSWDAEVCLHMEHLVSEDRLTLAAHAHGWLITHAGLAHYWDPFLSSDLGEAVAYLNEAPKTPGTKRRLSGEFVNQPDTHWAMVNAVSHLRGGHLKVGGILWRDHREGVSEVFRQISGHSASRQGEVRMAESHTGKTAYNIDVGGKYERRLAAMWLPDEKVVRVDL